MQRGGKLQDEPFIATAKWLMKTVRDKRRDLESGQWNAETDARVLVAEIALLNEILVHMQESSNTNFGEQELE